MIKKLFISFLLFLFIGVFLASIVKSPFSELSQVELFEDKLARESLHLIPFPVPPKPTSVIFQKSELDDYQIYAKSPSNESYFHINKKGEISSDGKHLCNIKNKLQLYFSPHNKYIFVDGKRISIDLKNYKLFYLTKQLKPPEAKTETYPKVDMADSFMRTDLYADSNWTSTSGEWELNQYGAGLVDDRKTLTKKTFPRTVNPFTVRGSQNGILSYGKANNLNYLVEAGFYFGVPQTSQLRNTYNLPGTFALIHGKTNGNQVKFGWDSDEERFIISEKPKDGAWKIVKKWQNKRPPISSWMKLGLSVKDGFKVDAYIDEIPILEYESKLFISGSFHIESGTDLIEFDDVKARNIDTKNQNEVKLTPLFIKSTNFSTKKLKRNSDEPQYEKWARGVGIFTHYLKDSFYNMSSTDALPGNVYYQSIPYTASAENLKDGTYIFRFLKGSAHYSDTPEKLEELFSLKVLRKTENWIINDEKFPEINGKNIGLALQISRLKKNNNRPAVFIENKWIPIAEPVNGFIHVSVAFDKQRPHPEHHQISCTNIINELFEKSPTEWSWTEGKFRMASRWACANMWNFMACGGTGTPWMASKKRFWGNQSHEYYMSLRPVQPPDGGDDDFFYDPKTDAKWAIFRAHFGWYNKHDLNFAFCSDGVNPLSGYAVIYAAEENTKNFLLRKGKVVAENSIKLMPDTSKSHGPIHWKWWNFRCSKHNDKIVIKLNDEVLFEYIDKEPLDGGHVGFFTVRNGFSVSKISSFAEKIDRDPFFMFVEENEFPRTEWYPLTRDNVKIEKCSSPYKIKVTQQIGGGNMAMRRNFDKIDLEKNPVLRFPLMLSPETSINLFLYISGRSYVIQLNDSAIRKTKALLTPRFEKGEMFQLEFKNFGYSNSRYLLGKVNVKNELRVNLLDLLKKNRWAKPPYLLETLTLGNTSEENFLLFGAEKNRKGAYYKLGDVKFEHGKNEDGK